MIDPTQTQPLPIGMHRADKPWNETSAEPAIRQPAEAALPDRLADRGYRLRARLGKGRLGPIFEAQDDLSQKSGGEHYVAIQLLDEKIVSQPNFASDFERGAVELQSISHPNIVKLLEYGRDSNRYYLVMELLESASLRFVLNDTAELPLEETAAVVRAVGDALQYLHAKSIVHGSLKPENVLVTFGYEVKLLDVVPTGWLDADAAASGRPKPDTRDDVFGLACLTYEMLTGRHPFNANTAQEAYRAGLEPAPIAKLNSRQWRALAGALALHRDDRTPNVAQFLHDFGIADIERLRTIVSSADEPAPEPASVFHREPTVSYAEPESPVMAERYAPFGTRRPGIAGKAMLLLAVIGIGAVSYIYQDRLRDGATSLIAAIEAARLRNSTATTADRPAESAAAGAETDVPATAAPLPRAGETITDPAPAMVLAPGGDAPKSAGDGAGAPAAAAPSGSAPATAAPSTNTASSTSPAPSTPAATPGFMRFGFAQSVASVRESDVAARIVITRSGDVGSAGTVAWWTRDDTAVADVDYADLGARVERFAPGEHSRTVFVPLTNDTAAESTKSFNVYLGRGDSARSGEPQSGMRVEIIDDD